MFFYPESTKESKLKYIGQDELLKEIERISDSSFKQALNNYNIFLERKKLSLLVLDRLYKSLLEAISDSEKAKFIYSMILQSSYCKLVKEIDLNNSKWLLNLLDRLICVSDSSGKNLFFYKTNKKILLFKSENNGELVFHFAIAWLNEKMVKNIFDIFSGTIPGKEECDSEKYRGEELKEISMYLVKGFNILNYCICNSVIKGVGCFVISMLINIGVDDRVFLEKVFNHVNPSNYTPLYNLMFMSNLPLLMHLKKTLLDINALDILVPSFKKKYNGSSLLVQSMSNPMDRHREQIVELLFNIMELIFSIDEIVEFLDYDSSRLMEITIKATHLPPFFALLEILKKIPAKDITRVIHKDYNNTMLFKIFRNPNIEVIWKELQAIFNKHSASNDLQELSDDNREFIEKYVVKNN